MGRPVTVGGVQVAEGDWVVGDGDGVVVIPGGALDEVLAAGRARADKEAAFFAELSAGRTTVELLGLDEASSRTAEPGEPDRSGTGGQRVTRLGGTVPASTSHTPWQARRAIRVLVWVVALPTWGSSTCPRRGQQSRVAPPARRS